MNSSINLEAIMIANIMGIVILFVIAVGNIWRVRENSKRSRYLRIMFFVILIPCIVDPICFLADGKPGLVNYLLVLLCNTVLYFCGLATATTWILLVADSIHVRISPLHKGVLTAFFGLVVALLFVNLFVPLLFSVDEYNVYSRKPLYNIYSFCYVGFILDGLILYLRKRHSSGGLKFFPVWAFIIPASLGMLIQNLHYGVSTINPFIAVSLVCMNMSFQNEFLFKDKLTGLYNRFYLNTLERNIRKQHDNQYSAVMLDINQFKNINDTYGHVAGDRALTQTASILVSVVDHLGETIRYAGDEFIIVLNTPDQDRVQKIIDQIHSAMDAFNKEGQEPYTLSVSAGFCRICFAEKTLYEIIDQIDRLMYEDKRRYWERQGVDRRRR